MREQGSRATQESWSIHEALEAGYEAFIGQFGSAILWRAFDVLTRQRAITLRHQKQLERDVDKYLQYPLHLSGQELESWMEQARADPDQDVLLLQVGVRWWLARDDLLNRPAHSRVPCVYADGLDVPVRIQLLSQLLYRGRAPYTTCD